MSPTASPTPVIPIGSVFEVKDIRIKTERLSDLKCRLVSQVEFPAAASSTGAAASPTPVALELNLTEANPARVGGTISIGGLNPITCNTAKFSGKFTWDSRKAQCGIRLSVTGKNKDAGESFKVVLVGYREGNRLIVDSAKSKIVLKTPASRKSASALWNGESDLANPSCEATIAKLKFTQADAKGILFRSGTGTMKLPWGESLGLKALGLVEKRSIKRARGGGTLERRVYTMQFLPTNAGRFTMATNWFTPGAVEEFPLQSATYKSYLSSGILKPPKCQDFEMTLDLDWLALK